MPGLYLYALGCSLYPCCVFLTQPGPGQILPPKLPFPSPVLLQTLIWISRTFSVLFHIICIVCSWFVLLGINCAIFIFYLFFKFNFIGVQLMDNVVLVALFFFFFLMAAPVACGGSQAREPIRAAAASLCHSHSNARSELHLWSTPQLTATPYL